VALTRPVKARGAVESWLSAVEGSMRSSLRAAAKKAVKEYPGSEGRESWALQVGAALDAASCKGGSLSILLARTGAY
jgi:hypothetical protein